MARQTIFEDVTSLEEHVGCKSAQSVKEVRENYRQRAWDQSTDLESIKHVERPRYGHKV